MCKVKGAHSVRLQWRPPTPRLPARPPPASTRRHHHSPRRRGLQLQPRLQLQPQPRPRCPHQHQARFLHDFHQRERLTPCVHGGAWPAVQPWPALHPAQGHAGHGAKRRPPTTSWSRGRVQQPRPVASCHCACAAAPFVLEAGPAIAQRARRHVEPSCPSCSSLMLRPREMPGSTHGRAAVAPWILLRVHAPAGRERQARGAGMGHVASVGACGRTAPTHRGWQPWLQVPATEPRLLLRADPCHLVQLCWLVPRAPASLSVRCST